MRLITSKLKHYIINHVLRDYINNVNVDLAMHKNAIEFLMREVNSLKSNK